MEIQALDFLPLPNSQILRLTLWVELGLWPVLWWEVLY